MIHAHVMRDLKGIRESARKTYATVSDNNAAAQASAALGRAIRRLPRVVPVAWTSIYVRGTGEGIVVEMTADYKEAGYDYDFVVDNCSSVNLQKIGDDWFIGGNLVEALGGGRARVGLNAPVPSDAMELMYRMGFVQTEPARTVPHSEVFLCK